MPPDMLIKQMPDELKTWIADEARRHRRSMNKEALALLELPARSAPANRAPARATSMRCWRAFAAYPTSDRRTADEILGYDDNGLPA